MSTADIIQAPGDVPKEQASDPTLVKVRRSRKTAASTGKPSSSGATTTTTTNRRAGGCPAQLSYIYDTASSMLVNCSASASGGGGGDSSRRDEPDDAVVLRLNVTIQNETTAEVPDAYNAVSDPHESKPCEVVQETLSATAQHDQQQHHHHHPPSALGQGEGAGAVGSGSQQQGTAPRVVTLLRDFQHKSRNNEWPSSTQISCYWCCHPFDTPPMGIPCKVVDGKYYVFGCFCSLECAAAYNFHQRGSVDEVWSQYTLINQLSRDIGHKARVKPAPDRLALKMFGGHLSIQEFRSFCYTSKIINVNFPPMMTLTQQLEEVNECDLNTEYRYVPLDTERINRYKEKIKLKRSKPIHDADNTLDRIVQTTTSTK